MKRKALLVGGGTGGHIFPAIAIGKKLMENNVEILYVGNKGGMEEKLAKDFDFQSIDVQKLYRKITAKHLLFPYKFIKSITKSIKIISDYKPDFVVCTGGFVSGPVGIAAYIRKVPVFIQEQNSYPGITNKFLGRFAKKIYTAYDKAEEYFDMKKILNAGNPINPSLYSDNKEIDYEKYNLKKDSFKIFLFGGSQGSRILNNAFYPIITKLLSEGIEIFWQTGKWDYNRYKALNGKGIYIFDFTTEIGKIYNSTNVAIARAGAITIEELKTKKIPSILIPLAIAAGNHQYYNAKEMSDKSLSIIITENNLTSQKLYQQIVRMKENYQEYKNNYNKISVKNSAEFIAKDILNFMNKEGK